MKCQLQICIKKVETVNVIIEQYLFGSILYYSYRLSNYNLCIYFKQENGKKAMILYLDYGNTEKRDSTHLLKLPRKYLDLPVKLVWAKLNGKHIKRI